MFHRLIIIVTLLAFFGGVTLQLMPPKAALAVNLPAPIAGDCSQMGMPPPDAGPSHAMPCKGIDPECVKQNGCMGTASNPLRPPGPPIRFTYTWITYWLFTVVVDGHTVKPELLPPIGL